MIILDVEPGSEEWHMGRCGVITMSHAAEMLTGGKGVTRRNYLLDVAAERLSGIPAESFQTEAMMRGIELESYALDAYRSETGHTVRTIGLAYLDDTLTVSASPDALLCDGGVEIKCPGVRAHMRYIDDDPKKHLPQCVGNMWIFRQRQWDFVSFCPEFTACPLVIRRFEMDDDMLGRLMESVATGLTEIDAMCERAGSIAYRDRDRLGVICGSALEHLNVNDGEVQL